MNLTNEQVEVIRQALLAQQDTLKAIVTLGPMTKNREINARALAILDAAPEGK